MNAIYIIYQKGDHLPFFITEDAHEATSALSQLRVQPDYNKNDWVFEIRQTDSPKAEIGCQVKHKPGGSMVGYHCEHRTY